MKNGKAMGDGTSQQEKNDDGSDQFWDLIALLDWDKLGDDDAVVEPVVAALARGPLSEIEAFEQTLSEKLYELDTRAHAENIGEQAYRGDEEAFSVDWFLYARCVVVANGRELFESLISTPSKMVQGLEFEALLYIAANAWERKTGDEMDFMATVSYETFSNETGWSSDKSNDTS
ncbi:MAG: DUF4240 domain-containing protein [Pseudomonadota bacterium]